MPKLSYKAQAFISKTIKKFYDRSYITRKLRTSDKQLLKYKPIEFQKKAIRVAYEKARRLGYKIPTV